MSWVTCKSCRGRSVARAILFPTEIRTNCTFYLYILSNKRNAPNIKLNHKFVITVEVFMNINVSYEYVKCLNRQKNFVITEP